jgi:hypothetical protein
MTAGDEATLMLHFPKLHKFNTIQWPSEWDREVFICLDIFIVQEGFIVTIPSRLTLCVG